jgi:hypothetical protein
VYSFRSAQVERVDSTACQYLSIDGQDWFSEWRGVFKSLNQLERLTVVRLRDLVELMDLLADYVEPPGPTLQLDVCRTLGRGLERGKGSASNIHSTLPSPHRKGCQTNPFCPLLHTLELVECHWLCSQFPVLLDFVKRRTLFTSPQGSPALSLIPCPTSTLHSPTRVSSIRRIRIQSNRPSLLPRSQDIEELKKLVDTVVTEAVPRRCSTSRGVDSYCQSGAGGCGRKPPLCAVCGTDLEPS